MQWTEHRRPNPQASSSVPAESQSGVAAAQHRAVPAGWYPEPNTENLRWWDGVQWTDHRRAAKSQVDEQVSPSAFATETTLGTEAVTTADVASTTEAALTEVAAVTGIAVHPSHAAAPSGARARLTKPAKPVAKMWKREVRAYATALETEADSLNELVDKHGLRAFGEIDSYRAEAESEIAAGRAAAESERAGVEAQLAGLRSQVQAAEAELAALQQSIIDVNAVAELQAVGLFDFEHPAASSATLASQLEQVRYEIKNRVRDKQAVSTAPRFLFNNSEAQGRKFVNDMSKVLLRAYNAEAENAVKATRAGNLSVAQKRLATAAEQIARSGTMIDLRIDPAYHLLRLREIALANDHLQALAREKELERDRRAELREQAKAEAELRKAKESLEKEKSHYLATLAALEANGDAEGAARMRAKLDDVARAIADVDYRAANIRAGYVYVISNIGAFGERMVKIGMTRRLEPMDRVNELGDASVPFRFDVHALFFADDAVGIETMLHQTFAAQRVNKVNLRREFFYATPDEVLEALKSHSVEVVEFTVPALADEFRTSARVG